MFLCCRRKKSHLVFLQETNSNAAIDVSIGDIEKGDNGPGFWKFNCSLLDDETYVYEVN